MEKGTDNSNVVASVEARRHWECVISCPGNGYGFDKCRKTETPEFCDQDHRAAFFAYVESLEESAASECPFAKLCPRWREMKRVNSEVTPTITDPLAQLREVSAACDHMEALISGTTPAPITTDTAECAECHRTVATESAVCYACGQPAVVTVEHKCGDLFTVPRRFVKGAASTSADIEADAEHMSENGWCNGWFTSGFCADDGNACFDCWSKWALTDPTKRAIGAAPATVSCDPGDCMETECSCADYVAPPITDDAENTFHSQEISDEH